MNGLRGLGTRLLLISLYGALCYTYAELVARAFQDDARLPLEGVRLMTSGDLRPGSDDPLEPVTS